MDSSDSETPCFMEELLNFSSDIEQEEEDDVSQKRALKPNGLLLGLPDSVRPWNTHELVEEELEWISNKDAFPAVESFMGVLPDHHDHHRFASLAETKDRSPISVLDGSTITTTTTSSTNSTNNNTNSLTSCFGGLTAPPRRPRTNRRRRPTTKMAPQHFFAFDINNNNNNLNNYKNNSKKTKKKSCSAAAVTLMSGRECQHCGADKTPQWRAGPAGPKTLCNACGVRFKSGRLVPEYRPASSPTFSADRHSNSHRKIVEMRRVKQVI